MNKCLAGMPLPTGHHLRFSKQAHGCTPVHALLLVNCTLIFNTSVQFTNCGYTGVTTGILSNQLMHA